MGYFIFSTIGLLLFQDLAAFQLSEILLVEDVGKHMDAKKISSIERMLSKKLEEKIMVYDEALKSQTKEVLARYLADLSFSEKLKQSLSVQQAIATTAATEAPTTNCDTVTVRAESVVDIITGAPAPTTVPASAPVAVSEAAVSTEASTVAATTIPTTRRPTVDPGHVLNQVDKILNNVAGGNIVGIVDESLRIRAPEPVRGLVTGILEIIFCNPFDRLLNRCRQKGAGAATGK